MLISVITVNYNNHEGLKRTAQSVLEQTYSPIQYIVIDGGSDDGSADYLKEKSNHIDYWVSEPDLGIYHAMNKGVKVAKGDYLLFLNSGDHFYSNESVATFKPWFMKDDKKDLIYGNIQVKAHKDYVKTYPEHLSFSYFVDDTLPHPATLIKTSCFDHLQYDETLKIVSDWKFFMIGICKWKFSYQYIDQVISTFYFDGLSSTEPDLVAQEKRQVLHDEFLLSFYFMRIKQRIKEWLRKLGIKVYYFL